MRTKKSGKPVVNATERFAFKVGRTDFHRGVPGSPDACALAQGACRHPGVVGARILRTTAFIEFADRVVRYSLREAGRAQVALFDVLQGKYAKPGVYTLYPPPPAHEPGRRAAYNAKRAERPAATRKSPGSGPNKDALTLAGVRLGTGMGARVPR